MRYFHTFALAFLSFALGAGAVQAQTPEDPCVEPGITVVTDPTGDVTVAGTPQHDIQRVSIAEPFLGLGVNKLVVTLKVAQLDPNNLPLNGVWRVYWTNPSNGVRYFVSMLTCDPTEIPSFDYGTTDGTLDSGLGDADQGSVSADGTIRIVISKSLVGNPQPAQTLTNVSATARIFVGALCSGLISTVDGTAAGTYLVRGNCEPVPARSESWGGVKAIYR